MSSRGIRTCDLAIRNRRIWLRFSSILGALSRRTYAQVRLIEEVAIFMVWFDPDLSVLRFHLNNTSPTARLTARCYCARRKDKSEFLSNFVSTKIKTIKPIILDQLCLPTPMAHQCFAPKCWPAGLMPTDRNPRHRTRLKNRIGLSKLETFLW